MTILVILLVHLNFSHLTPTLWLLIGPILPSDYICTLISWPVLFHLEFTSRLVALLSETLLRRSRVGLLQRATYFPGPFLFFLNRSNLSLNKFFLHLICFVYKIHFSILENTNLVFQTSSRLGVSFPYVTTIADLDYINLSNIITYSFTSFK